MQVDEPQRSYRKVRGLLNEYQQGGFLNIIFRTSFDYNCTMFTL